MTIIFFGSFQHYSVQVLEKLVKQFSVTAVITTPPKPAGRHMKLAPTAVEQFARARHIPVLSPEKLDAIPNTLKKPDFIVVAGYGKLIPPTWLELPKIMAINMHPSLLPDYRGAFPAEWAILKGEKKTGVTLVKMSSEFDKGEIVAQQKIPIATDDTRETLYKKLYDLGADVLVEYLPKIKSGSVKSTPQPAGNFFYARRITREDGFVSWEEFKESLSTNPSALDTKFRALTPWPGVWTTTAQNKRLKLISIKPPVVQLEGKKPTPLTSTQGIF